MRLADDFGQCASRALALSRGRTERLACKGTAREWRYRYERQDTTLGCARIATCRWNTPGLLSTVQIEYGGRAIPATRTTPDACALQGLLAAMRCAGCDSAVMEVSSHALEQQRTAFLRFEAAVFTNLSQDHLDYHGSMEANYKKKQQLFKQLTRPSRRGSSLLTQ